MGWRRHRPAPATAGTHTHTQTNTHRCTAAAGQHDVEVGRLTQGDHVRVPQLVHALSLLQRQPGRRGRPGSGPPRNTGSCPPGSAQSPQHFATAGPAGAAAAPCLPVSTFCQTPQAVCRQASTPCQASKTACWRPSACVAGLNCLLAPPTPSRDSPSQTPPAPPRCAPLAPPWPPPARLGTSHGTPRRCTVGTCTRGGRWSGQRSAPACLARRFVSQPVSI